MQDQLRDLWARPSRLLGWGVVAAIHLLMWQVLTHGLNVFQFVPALNPVEVVFLEREQLPPVVPPQPQVPKVDTVVTDLYVPTPEVVVVRENVPQLTTTSIMPVAAVPEQSPPAVRATSQSSQLVVISDSEVDYVVRPEIHYPLAAKRAREHGTVLLSVIVDERGLVRHIRIYQSSGYQRLDEVALRAVRALRVKPYIRNGTALSVEIRVPVEFSLSAAV